jgi:hypothetical protein
MRNVFFYQTKNKIPYSNRFVFAHKSRFTFAVDFIINTLKMKVMKKLYLVLVLVLNFGLQASKIQNSNLNPSNNGDSTLFVDDALQFIKVKSTNQLSEYDVMLERRLEIKKHYVYYLTMVDAIILSSIDNGAVFEEKNSYFKEFKNEKLIFVASFSDFKLEIVRKRSASDYEINQVVVFFNSIIEKEDYNVFYEGYVQKIWLRQGINTNYTYKIEVAVGYDEVPEDILMVATQMVADEYKKSVVGKDLLGIETVGVNQGGASSTTKYVDLTPKWNNILNKYRILGF